jgi:ribosomal protein S19
MCNTFSHSVVQIGHKLGEFAPTRKKPPHKAKTVAKLPQKKK